MKIPRKQKQRKESDILDNKSKALRNRETNVISIFFIGLFLVMAAYLVYFNIRLAPEVVNNSYNKRIANLENDVTRGRIVAADGTVIAQTLVDADGREVRHYPFGRLYSHAVGLKLSKSSIEGAYYYELLSTRPNILEEIAYELKGEKRPGNDIITSLNPVLQKAAFDALGNNKGAVVAMEPATGKILAMVSKPDYDPNDAERMYNSWIKLEGNSSVLLNRATNGLYAPGSTFKIITALEYMRENSDYAVVEYECKGSTSMDGGTVIHCANNKVHGVESFLQAFGYSCNTFFSDCGFKISMKQFRQVCETFGFNKELKLGFETAKSSFLLDESSGVSEIQETSIGQGRTVISPIHNLMIISAIANKGVMMKPYYVMQVQSHSGKVLKSYTPSVWSNVCSESEASYIGKLCRGVVTDGTGYAFAESEYNVAGKTGTAQFDSSDLAHSWFVGYAPYEEPTIAISVVLEGGYSGSSAQYVAKRVLDAYCR